VVKEEPAVPRDEVAYRYAEFCRERALVLQRQGKGFELCHICFFSKGWITPVEKSGMLLHCIKMHRTEGFPCERTGCVMRAKTQGDAGLHHHYCHGQKSRDWWCRYLEEHGHP
ncbi:unnamed protein product, partial [Urochloa humidicola]